MDDKTENYLYVVKRTPKFKSEVFIRLMNQFGKIGAYEKILTRIQNKQKPLEFRN